MKFLLLFLFMCSVAYGADVKISQLPLGAASQSGATDALPYVHTATGVTNKLNLWDIANIPTITATYAKANNPTFTGLLTAPAIVDTGLTANRAVVTDGGQQLQSLPYSTYLGTTAAAMIARDINNLSSVGNLIQGYISQACTGTITLTAISSYIQNFSTSGSCNVVLPDATTLFGSASVSWSVVLNNNSSGTMTIKDNSTSTLFTIPAGGGAIVNVKDTSTSAGVWDYHFYMPANASYGTAGIAVTGTISATGQMKAANGSVSAPSLTFTNQTDSGLYRVGSNEIGLAIVGSQALDFKQSSGSFGNVGMGGAASTSDAAPLLLQRTYAGQLFTQLSNPSTAAGAASMWSAVSDNGNNTMNVMSIASASASPDIYNGGAGVLRFTGSGTSTDMVLVSDVGSGSKLRFYAGGDAVTNRIATMSSSGLTLGVATSLSGALNIAGSSSGTISVLPQAAAGTYNFNLPITAGTSGYALLSAGGGSSPMTWGNVLTNPMTTTGDIIYSSSGSTPARLAANSTATNKYLQSVSSGTPAWVQVAFSDLSGTATAVQQVVAANAQSASYSLLSTDRTVLVTTGSTNRTMTLPDATGAGVSGQIYTIIKVDSGTGNVPIATTSSQTVGGRASSNIVLQIIYDTITVVSDGANWQIVNKNETSTVSNTSGTAYALSSIGAGNYGQIATSITTGIGQWRVYFYFILYGGTAGLTDYITASSGIYDSDGANSASAPTALSGNISGFSHLINSTATGTSIGASANLILESHTQSFKLVNTTSHTIYCVPSVGGTTLSNSSVACVMWAERVW